ncbi:MAG: LysM peptidoglycan-binding domain-containing protein [Phycisphaeraceae bacterium]|nr:LysM peptidoglycan-binding domain-containing protein [Phycisphaeraceae bacterium]
MTHHPGRVVGGLALLLGVWVVTYWLWTPSAPRITFGESPRLAEEVAIPLPRAEPAPEPPPVAPTPQAAGTPRMVQRVVPPKFRDYTVQKGDVSWDVISRRAYGDAKWASAISRANPFVSPDKLKVGKTKLRIPEDPTNIQGKVVWVPEETPAAGPSAGQSPPPAAPETKPVVPTPGPGSSWPMSELVHEVKPGETLSSIAKQYYSAPAGYLKIYQANRDQLPSMDRIKPGMKLRIPPGP